MALAGGLGKARSSMVAGAKRCDFQGVASTDNKGVFEDAAFSWVFRVGPNSANMIEVAFARLRNANESCNNAPDLTFGSLAPGFYCEAFPTPQYFMPTREPEFSVHYHATRMFVGRLKSTPCNIQLLASRGPGVQRPAEAWPSG